MKVLEGQGCTRLSAAEDNFARGKADGDRPHRPSRPPGGIHGWLSLIDDVCGHRFEVDVAVKHEKQV